MIYKQMGFGLGLFSLALGAAELLGSKRVTGTLGVEGHEALVKAFGVRELLNGAGLLAAPATSTNVWMRVAGDAMDLAALGLAAPRAKRGALMGAFAFVIGATLLDVVTARGLDATTGRMLPGDAGDGKGAAAAA